MDAHARRKPAQPSDTAMTPEVEPDHLNRIIALANKIGRRPTSNAVIRELKAAGIGVGRATANKILDALDRTHLEDHWTGPRLKVVHPGETGPETPDPSRTESPSEADRTPESTRSETTQSDGPQTASPPDPAPGPRPDRDAQSGPGPATAHRIDHPESDRETTRTAPIQTTQSDACDHLDQFPTVDPDWPADQQQTTGPERTEPMPHHPDSPIESTAVHPAESTHSGADAPSDRPPQPTGPNRSETTPVHPAQDRDRPVESTGPTMVAAPSAKAQKLLQSARQASEIRAYQTDPDVIALRAEKIRAWTGRLVWTGLILGLLFTAGNVQSFGAQGAAAWSTGWWTAWVLDPMVSLVLVGLLLAESVTSRYGVETGRWMRAAKWFALAATYAMNTWGAWGSMDPALILLHSVPPGLVFFATEAITDAWDKITEAVNVAVERAARRADR